MVVDIRRMNVVYCFIQMVSNSLVLGEWIFNMEGLPITKVKWFFGSLADHCKKQGTLRSRNIENTQKLGDKHYSSFLQCQISPEL